MSFEAEYSERDRVLAQITQRLADECPTRDLWPTTSDEGGNDAYWVDVAGYPPNFTYALVYRDERGNRAIVLQSRQADAFVEDALRVCRGWH